MKATSRPPLQEPFTKPAFAPSWWYILPQCLLVMLRYLWPASRCSYKSCSPSPCEDVQRDSPIPLIIFSLLLSLLLSFHFLSLSFEGSGREDAGEVLEEGQIPLVTLRLHHFIHVFFEHSLLELFHLGLQRNSVFFLIFFCFSNSVMLFLQTACVVFTSRSSGGVIFPNDLKRIASSGRNLVLLACRMAIFK